MEPYSIPAIEYAFDHWGRNGTKFPLPADIIKHIDAYCSTEPSFERVLPSGRRPLDSYWPIYYWMFEQVSKRVDEAKSKKQPYVPLNEKEIKQLEEAGKRYYAQRVGNL